MFEKYEFLKDSDLSKFSTMKTGGKANYIIFPKNTKELQEILKIIKKNQQKSFILGNGSNVLFDDEGFDGVIISLKHFDKLKRVSQNFVWVGAGINLFALNVKLKDMNLSGLEWSFGIPATLGGFVVMNGGCFGHEICELVEEVEVIENKKIKILDKNQLEFGYRCSNLKHCIVLNVKMKMKQADKKEIEEQMKVYLKKKKDSQPCDKPSLGSVFKVIYGKEIVYPAKIIDNLGLKGVKIGGAEVSCKHSGFIVNAGNATSGDVLKLIELLEAKLLETGIFPEREIIVLKKE